jgi:chorismate synthase
MQTKGKLRPNSKLHTRMKLYAAASRIVMSEETMRTMETAGSISPEMLDQGDVKILNAVNLIGDRILMNQENMLLELETRMSAPDRSQKQKETDLQEQEVIRNEVEHNPVVQRATTLFEEIGSLAPELAQ